MDVYHLPQPDGHRDNSNAGHDGHIHRGCDVLRVSKGFHFNLAGLKGKVESHPEIHTLVQHKDTDYDIVHFCRANVNDIV